MKNCPFCQAQIADEANFCLHCMTPLNEKAQILPPRRRSKSWLLVLNAILLSAVIVLLLWPSTGDEPAEPMLNNTTAATTAPTTAPTTVPTTGVTTNPTTAPTTAATTVPTTTKPTTTKPTTTKPTTTPSTSPTTLPTASNQVQYTYRAAKAGDSSFSNSNLDSCIVITGVQTPATDGVYNIPDTIDGKTVIAIASSAFYNSGAATVYIPASITTIHGQAFFACPLSDVYFAGKYLYCYDSAFPTGFSLHCPPDCVGRDSRFYIMYAYEIGATWREWHNAPLMTATDEYGVVYNYRMSTAEDHPNDPTYQNPGNHITITSVQTRSADNTYHIPKTLDGLTVSFIGPMAFYQNLIPAIYLPESVLAISHYAFYYGGVEDLYFCHDLCISTRCLVLLAETTLHCPKDAQCGPGGKIYSENPRYWDAGSWEEWNGVFPSEVVYAYRLAQAGDDFSASYQNPGDHIVITGVETLSSDGVYDIPATIDGKTVIAIGELAFDGVNAKKIYISEGITNIAANAFSNCAVTDIYFTHNIYIDYDAFPASDGILTIHCTKSAHNRSYAAYQSNAHYYGATWEEWNGEA